MKRISILLVLSLSSCSFFERHPDSGYMSMVEVRDNSEAQLKKSRKRYRKTMAAQELGISTVGTVSAKNQKAILARMKVNQLENQLKSHSEKKQYYYYLPMLENDFEKIQFLKQKDMAAREKWAQWKGLSERQDRFPASVVSAIENKDVVMGMTQNAVVKSWGDPDSVAVAGNPMLKNERWTYQMEIPTEDGFVTEVRSIYFESGRVVGWEKQ